LTRSEGILLIATVPVSEWIMVHLIKLCVGVDSLQELADWQKKRLKEKGAKGQKPELMHVTRQTPKRADELLDGGSLYWVIKGQIAARQRLIELREVSRNGVPHCGLVYDKKLVPVRPRPRRALPNSRAPKGCRRRSSANWPRWDFSRLQRRRALVQADGA
jgi:hypothetical protein